MQLSQVKGRLGVLVLSLLTTFPAFGVESAAKSGAPKWQAEMQDLYRLLGDVLTDVSSDARFNSSENFKSIQDNAKRLADRAHRLTLDKAPDNDPTLQILSQMFQDETSRAYTALKSGNRSYGRMLLSQVSSFCIACHTRNSTGPSFSKLPLEPSSPLEFPIEKGKFYAATRQFDRAFDLFQQIVADSSGPVKRPIEWEQAFRFGITIAVRVQKDPDKALSLVNRVMGSKTAPYFLRQDAQNWKTSIEQWKKELPRKAATEEGLFSEAVRLIAQAREEQKYPLDHSADITYLRASAIIHELLQMPVKNAGRVQEALLMAGMCYEVLRATEIDDLHEVYYEACIKRSPNTSLSEVCYRKYEQSTYLGYTGSSGTHLPDEVVKKLKALEGMAHPEGGTPDQKLN